MSMCDIIWNFYPPRLLKTRRLHRVRCALTARLIGAVHVGCFLLGLLEARRTYGLARLRRARAHRGVAWERPRPGRGHRIRDSTPGAAPVALAEGQRPVLLVRARSVTEGRTRGKRRVHNAGLIRSLMVR